MTAIGDHCRLTSSVLAHKSSREQRILREGEIVRIISEEDLPAWVYKETGIAWLVESSDEYRAWAWGITLEVVEQTKDGQS